jgi:hypothetical protein
LSQLAEKPAISAMAVVSISEDRRTVEKGKADMHMARQPFLRYELTQQKTHKNSFNGVGWQPRLSLNQNHFIHEHFFCQLSSGRWGRSRE